MVETEDAAGYVEYSDYCNLEQKYNMLASALAVAWSYLGPFVGGASFKEAYDAVHSAIYLSEDTLRIEGDALAERNEGKGRPS